MCIRDSTQTKQVSDETAKSIDEEVRDLIDRNYDRAETILKNHLDELKAMADALMKYETIDKGQIDNIMKGEDPGEPSDWWDSNDDASSGGTKAKDETEKKAESDSEVKQVSDDKAHLH